MNETPRTPGTLSIPAAEADRLLACADGMSALLYLHILRTGTFSLTRAARELRCAQGDIARAAENLRRLGLMPQDTHLETAELPQYSAGDIALRSKSDPCFEQLVLETQNALGRLLSSNDMRLLFGIYDHLGLPAEVILLLVNHCIERFREQNGEGRMPTLRTIEKEAWFWADREIVTLDAAEEHIRREKERAQSVEQVRELLQIRARALTPTERKYIESWLGMGFTPACLAIAYDRTVIGTGRLTWKYMDKILQSWSGKGLFTPEAVERGDARPGRQPAPTSAPAAGSDAIDAMRRMYEHMKKGD